MNETIKLVKEADGSWRSWDDSVDQEGVGIECIDVIPVVQREDKTTPAMDIERRVALSLAVGRYLRSADKFNTASHDFTEACKSLRKSLGNKSRFIVQVDYKNYLVTSDNHGNFDVEMVESV